MTDILEKLEDLHKQATEDNSHFYTGKVIREAMLEIVQLRSTVHVLRRAS